MNEKELLELAVQTADSKNAHDIVALDMRGVSPVADYFVIGHGTSEKQVQAIATELKKAAHKQGLDVQRLEGYNEAKWVLIDLGDVVVHIFHEDERDYYNLEKLWGDAVYVELGTVLSQ
ncbi:ribosome silencing factor [Marinococcus sp. PL1-022]|jgi:ribosome-associated protein|uniref:ribosome silencing factor n=1 Tax=Marinococcus sp. PL1-022 TaxID=3095363 RepID=UPI0029C574EC|nr:ribosome silencing factor [Marinococcus sp. PL1-022]MDX6153352.1 ribosome silencing factor [Marinococcus sp. PL1-022]